MVARAVPVQGPPSRAQRSALKELDRLLQHFLLREEDSIVMKDWKEELRSRRIDYAGEEVTLPEKLTLEQLSAFWSGRMAALPQDGAQVVMEEMYVRVKSPVGRV